MGGAGIRQERIEQRAIIPSCWFHHIGGVHQRGYEKSRLARRGVVLIERASGVATAGLALTTPAFGHLDPQNHEKDKGLIHQKPPTAKNDPLRLKVQG